MDKVLRPLQRVGSGWGRWWAAWLAQVHHCSLFTFRAVQTVGVNAAKTTEAIKFPRFTLGCVPRRQEEREEGTTEEEVRRKEGVEEGDYM